MPKILPVHSVAVIEDFLEVLRRFYEESGRHDMAWRQPEADSSFDPYKILVSELMLQQTQVNRVAPKYKAFLEQFSDVRTLAAATLGEVLALWNGLGYNRRAKYLHQAAAAIVSDFDGVFPSTAENLVKLPGVGPNTAGALMTYAYDTPVVFIETNIRTVIIHHFFKDQAAISDATIREVVAQIVDTLPGSGMTPREFYWAMMDYGSYLKQSVGNLNRASSSYSRQSSFEGSRRQVRGRIIKLLSERPYTASEFTKRITDDRLMSVLDDLTSEGLISRQHDIYSL